MTAASSFAPSVVPDSTPLIELRQVVKEFQVGRTLGRRNPVIQAVSGVDLSVRHGEVVSVVGESGCGKSTLMKVVLGLELPDAGEVWYGGVPQREWRSTGRQTGRHFVQAVFQDPWASLNPRMRVGSIVGEPLRALGVRPRSERRKRVSEVLTLVGLDGAAAPRFPHEFSGGQRQRIALARSLVTRPSLVVLDEPVSSLDVSIRAQIINLLRDVTEELGTSLLMVSHDLATVRYISDRVAVMYMGRIVEQGTTEAVFSAPRHPYTQLLIEASKPGTSTELAATLEHALSTEVPSPTAPPSGCRFRTRCPWVMDVCSQQAPALSPRDGDTLVACHLYDD